MSSTGARPATAGGFRDRGEKITRLEGFSDCSYGFAITLLVLSLQVPSSFTELLVLMRGVPTFAITFAMIAYIWYTQYRYFRRFGTEDVGTVILNMALLFVVLVYVYPLKFLFAQVLGMRPQTSFEARGLYTLYGAGFFLVYALIALLYINGLRQAEALGLTPRERAMARGWMEEQWLTGAVGLASIALALVLPPGWLWLPGIWYFSIAAVKTLLGFRSRHLTERVAHEDR